MPDNAKSQRTFSELFPQAAYSLNLRERKTRTLLRVLEDFLKTDLKRLKLLDVGASTGAISYRLAEHFGQVVGVDTDHHAVRFAQQTFQKGRLDFALVDAMNLSFQDGVFDVVICAHIYEHVPDAVELLGEIYRVLKPGGICYFAADNRVRLREPHYGLPFLALVPKRISDVYLRLCGKGSAYEIKLMGHRNLRRLVEKFSVIDYTARIIQDPSLFHADYMLREGSLIFNLAKLVVRHAYWLCPSYIWLLQKRDG